MYQYAFALAHGSQIFYDDWIDKPGVALVVVMMVYALLF